MKKILIFLCTMLGSIAYGDSLPKITTPPPEFSDDMISSAVPFEDVKGNVRVALPTASFKEYTKKTATFNKSVKDSVNKLSEDVESDITTVKADITKVKSDITSTDERVAELTAKNNSLTSQLATLQTQIKALTEIVLPDNVPDEYITQLNSILAGMANLVNDVVPTINTRFDEANSRITNIENSATELNTSIAGVNDKFNKVEITTSNLTQRIAGVEDDIQSGIFSNTPAITAVDWSQIQNKPAALNQASFTADGKLNLAAIDYKNSSNAIKKDVIDELYSQLPASSVYDKVISFNNSQMTQLTRWLLSQTYNASTNLAADYEVARAATSAKSTISRLINLNNINYSDPTWTYTSRASLATNLMTRTDTTSSAAILKHLANQTNGAYKHDKPTSSAVTNAINAANAIAHLIATAGGWTSKNNLATTLYNTIQPDVFNAKFNNMAHTDKIKYAKNILTSLDTESSATVANHILKRTHDIATNSASPVVNTGRNAGSFIAKLITDGAWDSSVTELGNATYNSTDRDLIFRNIDRYHSHVVGRGLGGYINVYVDSISGDDADAIKHLTFNSKNGSRQHPFKSITTAIRVAGNRSNHVRVNLIRMTKKAGKSVSTSLPKVDGISQMYHQLNISDGLHGISGGGIHIVTVKPDNSDGYEYAWAKHAIGIKRDKYNRDTNNDDKYDAYYWGWYGAYLHLEGVANYPISLGVYKYNADDKSRTTNATLSKNSVINFHGIGAYLVHARIKIPLGMCHGASLGNAGDVTLP